MLKFINCSNQILCTGLLCSFLLLTGCYDDTHILESLKNQQEQIDELKDMCDRYNTSIEALQAVVSALQTKDYVTDVTPINQGSEIVGYTITFEKSGSVSIYNGKDGADGVDGHTPVIGVDQWTDGLWYWTIDGEWLLDSEGNMIRAVGTDGTDGKDGADGADGSDGKDGFTPVLKIENGYWYVSYDGGKTYGKDPVGQATGDNGYTMFDEVTYDEDYVYVTMNDGVTLKLPRATEDDMVNTYAGVSISLMSRDLTDKSIVLYGKVLFEDNVTADEFGVMYSSSKTVTAANAVILPIVDIYGDDYSFSILSLNPATTIYCTTYIKQGDFYKYGEIVSFTTSISKAPSGYTNLSSTSPANCYIVTSKGKYCLPAVQGNNISSVLKSPKSAEVLWESFGTDMTPNVCDLIATVSYQDGYVMFQTVDTFREGNAVISVKSESDDILWSWHIWFTDQPKEHQYREMNNRYDLVCTMMDRNLGATSATPGDVGALGLMYQWGRKDPFLGSSNIGSVSVAQSTIAWPSAVVSDSSTGTIEYAISHPTTIIGRSQKSTNHDWYYTGDKTTDNTRWTTSDKAKSIYDPCPAGWRVPDGGENGVWAKALGTSANLEDRTLFDDANKGVNFYNKFGWDRTIWYPVAGLRYTDLGYVGTFGYYWSASPADDANAYNMMITDYEIAPLHLNSRYYACSVRCCKE